MSPRAPRPYQREGIQLIRASFAEGHRAPLYVAPTGAGKTFTFCLIASSAVRHSKRVVVVVHRQELLSQTSRALDDMGIAHGLIAPGITPDPRAFVQVAMIGTLRRRLEQGRAGDAFDMVIFDEGHHATAGEWGRIRVLAPTARLLGVTATPERLDGQGLGAEFGGVYDDLILGPTTEALMADGYLCRAAVFAPQSLVDLEGVKNRGGDYAGAELASRMDRPQITGDAVAHYGRICPGAPAIAFCASVAHAQHVAQQFRAAGWSADSIDGELADGLRRQRIRDLGEGRLHVLTSCDIISEGTDIPVVTAAILLRPTQSLTLHLQQVGRALRPVYAQGFDLSTREGRLAAIAASKKPQAIVLDHVGNIRHGLPEEPRDWTLAGRPRNGRAREGAPALRVAQCPECFRAHSPAPACPSCGHAYEATVRAPAMVGGELVEVTEEDRIALAQQRAEQRREVGRATTLEALEAIARARGYKQAWARHVWNSRQRARATPNVHPPRR